MPREGQPRRKATGWGQLSCLEAKSHSTEKIKMLAASSNKAGPFLPPSFVDSCPGSRLWLCFRSLTFTSQCGLRWVCKLWCDLWRCCLAPHFPRCHRDSWACRDKLFFHGFHTVRQGALRRQLCLKTGSSISTEIQNKLSRHQQQIQVHRRLLITEPHSS